MHRLMTTGAPAGTASQSAGRAVVGAANDNPGRRLLLEMALETKIGVARHQHLVVDRAVRIVTSGAAFAHRFMLEHKRTALRCVTLTAGVVLGEQRGSAAPH